MPKYMHYLKIVPSDLSLQTTDMQLTNPDKTIFFLITRKLNIYDKFDMKLLVHNEL